MTRTNQVEIRRKILQDTDLIPPLPEVVVRIIAMLNEGNHEPAELEELFAPAFLRGNEQERENVKRLAWYTTEFGVQREQGELKIFGAGLLSGAGELDRVAAGQAELLPFSVESVIRHDKTLWEYNHQYFVFETMAELKEQLTAYFDTVGRQA